MWRQLEAQSQMFFFLIFWDPPQKQIPQQITLSVLLKNSPKPVSQVISFAIFIFLEVTSLI